MVITGDKFSGEEDFDQALKQLGYPSRAHAVLDRSAFVPPSIVRDVGTRAVVNSVRAATYRGIDRERRTFLPAPDAEEAFGLKPSRVGVAGVYVDDNSSPNFAFQACFRVGRHQGSTHLCHIFSGTTHDPRFFTALPNLVLTPSWLAKLTDTDALVPAVLRWAVRIAYGFCPKGHEPAGQCELCSKPDGSPDEEWVLKCISKYEDRRVKDYRESARAITADQRWLDAIRAGDGYQHVLLAPQG